MHTSRPFRLFAATLLAFSVLTQSVFATCGGGGGGGKGGVLPKGAPEAVYRVPWKTYETGKALPKEPKATLILLWFPTAPERTKDSELISSPNLTASASRGVAYAIIPPDRADLREKYKAPADRETFVLVRAADESESERAVAEKPDARIALFEVEDLIFSEIQTREQSVKDRFAEAEKKIAAGEKDAAIKILQSIRAERKLFREHGTRALQELKKLGVEVKPEPQDSLPPAQASIAPGRAHPDVVKAIQAGVVAENAGRYPEAEEHYVRAVVTDPADPTALRYLAEYYRHQTGQWNRAGRLFNRILEIPSDDIAQAVALHGLGKMTIHSGRYADGLALFERSIEAYPLPITYRNLAVFWFSEKQAEKAQAYKAKALALDPTDDYNQVFSAVYLASAGRIEEALEIAKRFEHVPESSYNLAAIWAQAGDKEKALKFLRRHFYEYEQYDAVRALEKKEAREDWMFANLYAVPEFDELTRGAKNAWMRGDEFCAPDQLVPVEGPPGPRTMSKVPKSGG